MSLAQIREPPDKGLVLLAGRPGSGNSTFCNQVVLNSLASNRPVIFVTTERNPSDLIEHLGKHGLGELRTGLRIVDAFSETVGLISPDLPNTVRANSMNLNSPSMAITKLEDSLRRKGILLAFDSLTSPYLFGGADVVKFMCLFLSRFAAEGNSVLVLIDEGCGREEDLVAMMSMADGIVRIELGDNSRVFNVIKHPELRPTRIEMPAEPERVGLETRVFDPIALREFVQAGLRGDKAFLRRELGDFVNLFWPNLAHWSGVLWDPKRFPMMTYEANKDDWPSMFRLSKEDEAIRQALFPRRMWILIKLFMPKSLSRGKDMTKVGKFLSQLAQMRIGIAEYLEDASRTDEHYFRVYESSDCWGLESTGAAIASFAPPMLAGFCKGLEYWKGLERDWNAVETKCIGLGDPYCEIRLVPGEIDGLKDSLEKDLPVVERIHDRLMQRLMGFLVGGKPLVEKRERLGSDIDLHPVWHAMGGEGIPAMGMAWSERYRMALRMGGAKVGKEVGDGLMGAEIEEGEAVNRILGLLKHCKVGEVTAGETIRMRGSCESLWTKMYKKEFYKWEEPCCFFTTGFLNGFFSAVKDQHVKETKCIALGDPYCEWEFG